MSPSNINVKPFIAHTRITMSRIDPVRAFAMRLTKKYAHAALKLTLRFRFDELTLIPMCNLKFLANYFSKTDRRYLNA